MHVKIHGAGSKEAWLQIGFEYHTPLWSPHNQHVTKASYGLGIDKYDGRQLSLWVFHTTDVPWKFDLYRHISLLEYLKNQYNLNESIILEYEYKYPIGNNIPSFDGEYPSPSEKMVYNFLERKKVVPPKWIKDPTNFYNGYFMPLDRVLNLLIELHKLINSDRKPSLPVLVYSIILFNSYNDQRYYHVLYNWEGGMRLEMPSMESLKNDLKNDNSPKIYRGTIPIDKLEEFMKLALEFMKKKELFDEAYELILANLEKIRMR